MLAIRKSSFTNLLIASFLILGQTLNAGDVTGRITDTGTGSYLPGANVILEGTAFGAASDRTGAYRISNVPPGSYTLNITYIGYEDVSVGINVVDGVVTQDVQLQATYVELGEVVVQGLRQGQVKALNQQKTAANIMNIVAREQMERFPDLNTAEVLQRIPGASITRDQGEGRYILLRGTEARLNSVSVNGERIASPSTENRYVELDVISTNQISSIEVTKALTPDMDGDAIGGSVNVVTRSAFDYDERVLKLSGGSGYSHLMGTPLFQGDFTFIDRFGANKNIGLTLSGNYYNSPRGSDNNEMEWGTEEDTSGADIDWALQNLELRDYLVRRDRYGLSGTLDYRLSEDHQFYIRGMLNNRKDWELRRRLVILPEDGDYVSRTEILGAALERQLKDRMEEQQILSIAGGGQHRFGLIDLDFTLSYSAAFEDKDGQCDPEFVLDEDVDLTLDLSDPDKPQYTITSEAAGYEHDAANWIFDGLDYEEKKTEGKDLMGSFNLKYPFVLGSLPGEAKVGGKYRMVSKERNNFISEYGWEGDEDVYLTAMLATDDEEISILDGDYKVGPSADSDKQRDWFAANRDDENPGGLLEGEFDHEASDGDTYEASENIISYYGMTTLNLNKLMILAGFRHELTSIDYTGKVVEYDAEGDYVKTTDATSDDSYSNILPMVHLRYQLTPQTNIRGAFTSGIARPNYYDLVPYKLIFQEDEEMAIGNPDLEPTTAYNFDLLAEHYLPGIGIASGGVFYKALDKIIYESEYEQVGGDYDGYDVSQMVNGKSAFLYGFEVAWQQQLTFLPGALSGLGIYANFTYTKSEAEFLEMGGEAHENVSLPGQAGQVGNLAISYEKFGFQGRLSMNYSDAYITEIGDDADHDEYDDAHLQVDFSSSYEIIPGKLQAYFEALNLTNAPLRCYIGVPERPLQREFYSWWVHAGLKFQL
ncbi:MAG: TonB-dependent receptor [Fidelibacterota bacterium]|nr:MAG: TonB-dependent receptor [Candidatus Neomarinimicrobiota bacterium]